MNMNNQRLFIIIFLIFIIIHLISTFECDEYSYPNDVSFDKKVHESPIVIIGTSLNKIIDTNIGNLFNVTFLVRCILKGRPTQRIIHIVQAGSLLGRRSCQKLNVNRQYIVFLEPFFDGTYRPADFNEIPYSNQINILLEKTCGLSRTYPFTKTNDTEAALTNKCPPAVSIDCSLKTSKRTTTTTTTATTTTTTTTTATATTVTTTVTTTTTTITVTATTTTTTTTQTSSVVTTASTTLFGTNSIDLAALALLLAEHQQRNLDSNFLNGQKHKSLFSDDDARKNGTNRLSYIIINLIHLIFFSILYV